MGQFRACDFVRFISVMVRVRGPDPKGKKMKRHAFHISDCGTTALSASGVLLLKMDLQTILDGKSVVETTSMEHFLNLAGDARRQFSGLVLTSASLTEPFLSRGFPATKEASRPQLITGAEVHILVENFDDYELGRDINAFNELELNCRASEDNAAGPGLSLASPAWIPMTLLAVLAIPAAEKGVRKLIEAQVQGSAEGWDLGWALPSVDKTHKTWSSGQFSVPGISSSGEGHGSAAEKLGDQSQRPFVRGHSSTWPSYGKDKDVMTNNAIARDADSNLMRIAVLGFCGSDSHQHVLHRVLKNRYQLCRKMQVPVGIRPATSLHRGARVTACGCPFGLLSPHHFQNSVTVGVISNMWLQPLSPSSVTVAPSLLMLDMQCLPGMEGGPVVDEDGNLVGMLDRPVHPKSRSAEVQLVLTADAIFPMLRPFAAAMMGAEDLQLAGTDHRSPTSWQPANLTETNEFGGGPKHRVVQQEPKLQLHRRREVSQETSCGGMGSQDASGPLGFHLNTYDKANASHTGGNHCFGNNMSTSSQSFNSNTEQRATVPVAETSSRSVVLVAAGEGSWASGVIVNSQGLILTNAHLLEPWRFGHEKNGRWRSNSGNSWMKSNRTSVCHHSCTDPSSANCQHGSLEHMPTPGEKASGDTKNCSQGCLSGNMSDDPPCMSSSLPSTRGPRSGHPGQGSAQLSFPQPASGVFPVPSSSSCPELLPEHLSCIRANRSSAGSPYPKVMVRVDYPQPTRWHRAEVVYVSQGPLDVALLQLMGPTAGRLQGIGIEMRPAAVGSTAIVIGHGIFGPHSDLQPSVSEGVVAKLVTVPWSDSLLSYSGIFTDMPRNSEMGQVPAMLQTTAAVHSGGSGGAVVNDIGNMIGLVTSNARHSGGSVLPHLNFSVPTALLARIFQFASSGGNDPSILVDMDAPNLELAAVWSLTSPRTPPEDPLMVQFPIPVPWELPYPLRRFRGADGQDNKLRSGRAEPGKSEKSASSLTTDQNLRQGHEQKPPRVLEKGSKFAKFLADVGTDMFLSDAGPRGGSTLSRGKHDKRGGSTPSHSEERFQPASGSGNETQCNGNTSVSRRSRL